VTGIFIATAARTSNYKNIVVAAVIIITISKYSETDVMSTNV
jgi:hypothetical protein